MSLAKPNAKSLMKILALEFSSSLRSVAICEISGSETRLLCELKDQFSRQITGPALLDQALQTASCKPAEIDLLAIGLGPGSYTGIRSAISIGQGWQLGLGTKAIGISSVEILAAQLAERGENGEFTIAIDAQQKELYREIFSIRDHTYTTIEPLKIAPIAQLQNTPNLFGPDLQKLITRGQNLYPSATTLANLAAARTDYLPAEKLEPIYLREIAFVKAPPLRKFGMGVF